jgi:predicted amino acid dehydrogenase
MNRLKRLYLDLAQAFRIHFKVQPKPQAGDFMKQVVSISLGSANQDFDFQTAFVGQQTRVRRFGTNGSASKAVSLLQRWESRCDVLGLGVARDSYSVAGKRYPEADSLALKSCVTRVAVTTGGQLQDILQEWAVRHVQALLPQFFSNARILFLSGRGQYRLAMCLAEYTPNLQFADPIMLHGAPKILHGIHELELYTRGAHVVSGWLPKVATEIKAVQKWADLVLREALQQATVIVAMPHEVDALKPQDVAGKVIVSCGVNDARARAWGDLGVQTIVDAAPNLHGHALTPACLDAMLIAATGRHGEDLTSEDYLDMLTQEELQPRILYPNGQTRMNRFAFVIHPLSQEYFKKVKPIELLSSVSPPVLMDTLEKAMAYAPPFVYSKITGIRSPTGAQAEGWLISVGGTPKEIMAHNPEFTYRRLLAAAEMARGLGAQIMGLGAFTKVVGDAGVTVAKRSPLPITTGNSYSASGALWAAHDAMHRMGLVRRPVKGKRAAFKAMVVGATGAIGSVCARLLATTAQEIYMVSPEPAKLLALQASILQETPDAKIYLSAQADHHIADMDMIVTATSGAGKKVLDIMKVKPGCIITDVARPLDLPAQEVAKRPDVLVIESGEIRLPGDVTMKNIGLPKNVAYACLAETIVLALEGKFENFTVGREIEWTRVREIYRLGLKHGMQLAAISGVNGEFSDADIAKVRTLALAARNAMSKKPLSKTLKTVSPSTLSTSKRPKSSVRASGLKATKAPTGRKLTKERAGHAELSGKVKHGAR